MENVEGKLACERPEKCSLEDKQWGTETEVRSYVERIARKVRRSFTAELDLEDLIALGYTGILQAKQTFDGTRGYGWMQHAYWRTYGAMVDGARQWSHYSHCRTLARRDQRRVVSVDSSCSTVSLNWMGADQRPEPHTSSVDMLQDPDSVQAESGLVERDLIRKIGWMTTKLPMDQRVILELLYHFEMTMKEVGEVLGHSKSWVSRKHSKAVSELQRLFDQSPESLMLRRGRSSTHSLIDPDLSRGIVSVPMPGRRTIA